MERDYFYPANSPTGNEPRTWEMEGATDAWSAARARAKEILSAHCPKYLTDAQDAEIRARFRILD